MTELSSACTFHPTVSTVEDVTEQQATDSPGDASRRQRMGQVDSEVQECGDCQWLGSSRQVEVCLEGRAQKAFRRKNKLIIQESR